MKRPEFERGDPVTGSWQTPAEGEGGRRTWVDHSRAGEVLRVLRTPHLEEGWRLLVAFRRGDSVLPLELVLRPSQVAPLETP